jgi:hypothetical protein
MISGFNHSNEQQEAHSNSSNSIPVRQSKRIPNCGATRCAGEKISGTAAAD